MTHHVPYPCPLCGAPRKQASNACAFCGGQVSMPRTHRENEWMLLEAIRRR